MRESGIDAPDIPVDADGRPILSSELVESIDTDSPEFALAFANCVPLLTSATPIDLGADPELQAVVIDSLRRFSVCMRENGVENFPDPGARMGRQRLAVPRGRGIRHVRSRCRPGTRGVLQDDLVPER